MKKTHLTMTTDKLNRRDFLEFFGRAALVGYLGSKIPFNALANQTEISKFNIPRLLPSDQDQLLLAPNLEYQILLSEGDIISKDSKLKFGANCDFNAFIPFDQKNLNDGWLFTNHEYVNPLIHSSIATLLSPKKTKEMVEMEMDQVGASVVRCYQEKNGRWKIDTKDSRNFRLTGKTWIPFSNDQAVAGAKQALGTLANCQGGITPWGHFLTCEENYGHFYGELQFHEKDKALKRLKKPEQFYLDEDMGWHRHFPQSPSHYGWVVEHNPKTQESKKLLSLGRFSHEGALCVLASDKRTVVYMGDDKADECLYKFISDQPNSLDSGTLYVASLEKKSWLPLKIDSHPDFKKRFGDQIQLLVETRTAAAILGGTPLDRPEDIKQDPVHKGIYVSLTNNWKKGRPHGRILKIQEHNNDPLSLKFEHSTFIDGGNASGISCPDNLLFDKSGNLWVLTDRSTSRIGKAEYSDFKNNGLHFIPMSGPHAGKSFQIASAPIEAELTGPCFSPDGETLFLSVQHPGEDSPTDQELKSNWPGKNGQKPKSSVVAISGKTMTQLVNYKG